MRSPAGMVKSKRSLAKAWLKLRMPVVAVIVLGIALGGGHFAWEAYVTAAKSAHAESVERDIEAFVEGYDDPIPGHLQDLQQAVPPEAASALRSGDAAAMRQVAARIASAVPAAVGVRLLPLGLRQPDYAETPPVSFATLDLMRAALRAGRDPSVEVHLYGRPEQHVAVLRRVLDAQGEPLGFVFAGFDVAELRQHLNEAPLPRGYAELSQRISQGRSLRVGQRGDGALRDGVITRTVPLPGSALRLLVWMPPPSVSQLGAIGGLLPVVASALLLLLVGVVGGLFALRGWRARRTAVEGSGAVDTVLVEDEGAEGVFASATGGARAGGRRETLEDITLEEVEAPVPGGTGGLAADGSETALDSVPLDVLAEAVVVEEGDERLSPSIFRAYDVRGVVDRTLDADAVRLIAQAIGTEAFERGQQTLVVARDGRHSSDALSAALIEGLTSTGRDVIDIGRVPSPVLYFSTFFLNTGSGVMVTGSHNPPEYNGLKIMLGGEILFGDAIAALRTRALSGNLREGNGQTQTMDLLADYIRRVSEDMPVALGNAFKVVVDCGNGVAGDVAPKLIRALGHDVVELYCEVDGSFPNHHPDPTVPENLEDLQAAVLEQGADLGLAFDGDGDRLVVVDDMGEIVWPDRLMMLYARDILSRHPGASIVYDVKCTSRLRALIEAEGGKPVMDKTGHSYMRNKLHETDAQLAGELSGHIFFKERWYGFDDGMYAAARLIEILMLSGQSSSDTFAELPTGITTPELRVDMQEGAHFALMEALLAAVQLDDAEVFTIDGLRAEFADGWGLVRASNTTPSLVFRFEADDAAAMARIQERFRGLVAAVEPALALPF